jgi:hypothetical protein
MKSIGLLWLRTETVADDADDLGPEVSAACERLRQLIDALSVGL